MDNLDVICIGAAIVDIPLQPVSKNIFDVDSYPLERIAMTTGGKGLPVWRMTPSSILRMTFSAS